MVKEIIKTTITIGDCVAVKGVVYRCDTRTQRECSSECDMFSDEKGKCCGYCYRYDREDVVFKKVCSEDELDKKSVLVRTPCIEKFEEKLCLIRMLQKL